MQQVASISHQTHNSALSCPTHNVCMHVLQGRQKDFVDTEKALGRTDPAAISSLVGYAGGRQTGPDGKVGITLGITLQ